MSAGSMSIKKQIADVPDESLVFLPTEPTPKPPKWPITSGDYVSGADLKALADSHKALLEAAKEAYVWMAGIELNKIGLEDFQSLDAAIKEAEKL
jgi:hypothetical protein